MEGKTTIPRRWIILFALLVLAMSATMLRADEAPHARAYLDLLQARLDQVGAEMSGITEAAEIAARALDDGRGFGVRGDDGLANELSNRAGAMMGYDGRRGEGGDVILYVFGLERSGGFEMEELLRRQLAKAAELKAGGSVVIGLGSMSRLRAYGMEDAAGDVCDAWVDNGGALSRKRLGSAGVNSVDHSVEAPMQTVLNAAVAWAFECEVFAALTRLDRVPVVRQSFEVDTLKKRWLRYGSQRFHHDRWLDPIAPGSLGRAYLNELGVVLLDIGTSSWRRLSRTANRACDTHAAGGIVWLRAGGRYLPHHVGGQLAGDPDVFTLLTHDGSNPNLPAPGKNDFVIAVGDCEAAGSWEWGEPELLRQAGRGVAWIINGYNTQPADLYRREVLVDLWGPVGDTVVRIKDYDTGLGPVSGVAAEAVMWMITAEMVGRIQDEVSADSAD